MLLSSGTTHRIGPGRIYVQLARQLAEAGFRSLRIDVCGVGDSVATSDERENDPYAETIFRDVDLTLEHARRHLAGERVVLMGLCSGAYAAFQSAAQLRNANLIESVMINPLTYFWKDGMSLDHTENGSVNALHYYLTAIVDPMKWVRLLSGNSQRGVWGGIRTFVRRTLGLGDQGSRKATASTCGVACEYGHPKKDHLPSDLERVDRRNRQLALFCSSSDPGHFQMMLRARKVATRLNRDGKLSLFTIDSADHTFSNPLARQNLIGQIERYLSERYPSHELSRPQTAPISGSSGPSGPSGENSKDGATASSTPL